MVKGYFNFLFTLVISISLFSILGASVLSINSGGDQGLIISPGGNLEGFFFSEPIDSVACGNSIIETGESCDDGNIVSGDGCSSTCSTEAASGGGGGGGGGGGSGTTPPKVLKDAIENLVAVPDSLILPSTVGIETKAKLVLINEGEETLPITWTVVALANMISFDEIYFEIEPGESKILEFRINPDETGIHSGKFVFNVQGKEMEVPVVLNSNSELSLFDIMIDLPDSMKSIYVGEKINGSISLIQMGLQEKVDVAMNYVIKDFEGNTYLTQTETIAVDGTKDYVHSFETANLGPGDYIIGAEVIYVGGIATASSQFEVKEEETQEWWILFVVVFIVLIILIIAAKLYKKKK